MFHTGGVDQANSKIVENNSDCSQFVLNKNLNGLPAIFKSCKGKIFSEQYQTDSEKYFINFISRGADNLFQKNGQDLRSLSEKG